MGLRKRVDMDTTITRKARFKPRADAGLLSKVVQEAWQDYQDRIASPARAAEVAETIAVYFETKIPSADFEVLSRYGCIAHHDHCNVRVYDHDTEDVAKYQNAFGIELPRKVPVCGASGYGYPSLTACEPEWGTKSLLRELDGHFAALLAARKQYKTEYKASTAWPSEYGKEHGQYPTWGEIEDRFPVLGAYLQAARKRA
jgi:hypothetical protein